MTRRFRAAHARLDRIAASLSDADDYAAVDAAVKLLIGQEKDLTAGEIERYAALRLRRSDGDILHNLRTHCRDKLTVGPTSRKSLP